MKSHEPIDILPTKQITVLLAEDQANFRKSLKILVELDGDIEVVAEAKNGLEAIRLSASFHPEVIIMDIAMPLLNGLQATREIMKASPTTRVLILSAHPDPEYILQAIISGASGYLIKQSSAQVLAKAVREVLKSRSYFSSSIPKGLRTQCRVLFDKSELFKAGLSRNRRSTGLIHN
jgi:DNA-binding NarL/FixJ family response regulator